MEGFENKFERQTQTYDKNQDVNESDILIFPARHGSSFGVSHVFISV
jgi:hypothetical protein